MIHLARPYMQEYFRELEFARKQQALCKIAELAAMSDVEHQKQLLAVRRERFLAMVQLRKEFGMELDESQKMAVDSFPSPSPPMKAECIIVEDSPSPPQPTNHDTVAESPERGKGSKRSRGRSTLDVVCVSSEAIGVMVTKGGLDIKAHQGRLSTIWHAIPAHTFSLDEMLILAKTLNKDSWEPATESLMKCAPTRLSTILANLKVNGGERTTKFTARRGLHMQHRFVKIPLRLDSDSICW
jgi:hypothetical protein